MGHTFTSLLYHIIFSTKDREPFLTPDLRPHLFPYMGGILREVGGRAAVINGPSDHVHVLTYLPPTVPVADALRVLKANSSRWVHEQWPDCRSFAWQAGYGAFGVSESNRDAVRQYVEDQEAHHRTVTFQEEFLTFLRRHGIAYDERYVWE